LGKPPDPEDSSKLWIQRFVLEQWSLKINKEDIKTRKRGKQCLQRGMSDC